MREWGALDFESSVKDENQMTAHGHVQQSLPQPTALLFKPCLE